MSVGTLTTGALRLAIKADRSDDPATKVPTEADVLAYGLFFAALVAAVVVPLVLSYRRRARAFLDAVYLPENRVVESTRQPSWLSCSTSTPAPLSHRGH